MPGGSSVCSALQVLMLVTVKIGGGGDGCSLAIVGGRRLGFGGILGGQTCLVVVVFAVLMVVTVRIGGGGDGCSLTIVAGRRLPTSIVREQPSPPPSIFTVTISTANTTTTRQVWPPITPPEPRDMSRQANTTTARHVWPPRMPPEPRRLPPTYHEEAAISTAVDRHCHHHQHCKHYYHQASLATDNASIPRDMSRQGRGYRARTAARSGRPPRVAAAAVDMETTVARATIAEAAGSSNLGSGRLDSGSHGSGDGASGSGGNDGVAACRRRNNQRFRRTLLRVRSRAQGTGAKSAA